MAPYYSPGTTSSQRQAQARAKYLKHNPPPRPATDEATVAPPLPTEPGTTKAIRKEGP
jgi:hypothetical protein